MKDEELWQLTQNAWSALQARFEPAVDSLVLASGLNHRDWGLLLAVLTFEPDATTPSHLLVRTPYTAAECYLKRLRNLADLRYLQEESQASFRLTPKGKDSAQQFIDAARNAMASADPLDLQESALLAAYFERLVSRCLAAAEPPDKWSIRLSHKLMPELNPPLPYTEQAITCLAAYRDDAHLAAWRSSGLSATGLEVLTLIWREQVKTMEQITDRLANRGHSEEVYIAAIDELRHNDFVNGVRSAIKITPQGQYFRNKVEADTNRFFYASWDCLTGEEKVRMAGLLVSLEEGLKESIRS